MIFEQNPKYLDPKNDFAFKKVFGSEAHKQIPISFLNAVFHLKGKEKIVDLSFIDGRQSAEVEARKESLVDVLVQDEKGVKYIIEMQVAKVQGFEKRAQYDAAKTYCAHFNKADHYNNLKKVIFLAITDYVVFPHKKRYKSDHITLDRESYEHDLKNFWFTFVELPKFNKRVEELKTIEEKWYYFLKHASQGSEVFRYLSNEAQIKEAYEILESCHWSESELQWYEKQLMNALDKKGMIAAAKTEGFEEGREEGLEEGREEEKIKTAQRLLALGSSTEHIAKATGLKKSKIEQLRSS